MGFINNFKWKIRSWYYIIRATGLPDVPNIVNVSDYRKALEVEWSSPASGIATAGHVTYVLQERHHVGIEYVPERMTAWLTVTRTDRTREQLRQLYAPGRWFQFRVAAINENGTRGYSSPSQQFFVPIGRRKSRCEPRTTVYVGTTYRSRSSPSCTHNTHVS